jgi:hypothetical protein
MDSNRITVDGRWEKFKAFHGEDDGERSFVLLYIEKKLEGNKKKQEKPQRSIESCSWIVVTDFRLHCMYLPKERRRDYFYKTTV